MTMQGGATQGRTESDRPDTYEQEDRVVSRRVENPTGAAPGDEDAYRAAAPSADPDRPDTDDGGAGGTAERAGHDLDTDDETVPTRSE